MFTLCVFLLSQEADTRELVKITVVEELPEVVSVTTCVTHTKTVAMTRLNSVERNLDQDQVPVSFLAVLFSYIFFYR